MAQLVMSGYQVNVVDVRALFDSRRYENTAVNNRQGTGNLKQLKQREHLNRNQSNTEREKLTQEETILSQVPFRFVKRSEYWTLPG